MSALLTLSAETRAAIREEAIRRLTELRAQNRIADYFPATGPVRRELYPKHLEFFRLGAEIQERGFMAANRVGKTIVGAYEMTCHLTGEYPEWWEGRRFAEPVDCWAAGDTAETTRDIVQFELFGPVGALGTGMIPYRYIVDTPSSRRGVADSYDTAEIRHKSGGVSRIGLKSYDQGRRKFQGTKKDVIWCDEEPPADVYDECMIRLMTRTGIMMVTFTPLNGLSEIALRFMPGLAPDAS